MAAKQSIQTDKQPGKGKQEAIWDRRRRARKRKRNPSSQVWAKVPANPAKTSTGSGTRTRYTARVVGSPAVGTMGAYGPRA
jgi:hypothetical protein